MSILYERISELCDSKGITGYRLCKDVGVSPNLITELKMDRRDGVSAKTAQKIADYFGVTTGYLLGRENEKSPAPEGAEPLSVDELLDRLSQAELVELMAKTAAKLKERGLE